MVRYPIPRKADLACADSWEPSLKAFEQLTVERGTSDLQGANGRLALSNTCAVPCRAVSQLVD
jgi:hypothetical protein